MAKVNIMKRLIAAALVMAAITAAPAFGHYKGCNTSACDLRVSYPHHRHIHTSKATNYTWAWTYTAFDACVVMKESSGEQGITDGLGDWSYYQWKWGTWASAQASAGVAFSVDPTQATLQQQTYVFNLYESGRYTDAVTGQPGVSHRLAWPNTVPECGG